MIFHGAKQNDVFRFIGERSNMNEAPEELVTFVVRPSFCLQVVNPNGLKNRLLSNATDNIDIFANEIYR